MMKNLVDQIIEFGEIRRGSLGVRGSNINAELTQALSLKVNRGAFVGEVIPDSAAAKAGIKSGDVIVSMNGNPIESFDKLRAKIATLGAGREATLGVIRDGKQQNIKVKLQEASSGQIAATQLHPMLQGATLNNSENGVEVTALESNSSSGPGWFTPGRYYHGSKPATCQ
ncbi:serine endoprotease DegQ [Alishewanella longhuensis]